MVADRRIGDPTPVTVVVVFLSPNFTCADCLTWGDTLMIEEACVEMASASSGFSVLDEPNPKLIWPRRCWPGIP